MNETSTRLASGIVYIALLLFAISYSIPTFFVLFGVFLIIATYEFCSLIKLKPTLPILICSFVFYLLTFGKVQNQNLIKTLLLLSVSILLYTLYFLFSKEINKINSLKKIIYLVGYILLPFIFISKIPFGKYGYNPKILIGIFILIWTNDTFAYIVGKSIGKHKLFERISPKKTIEGFIGGLIFCILAGYLIATFYIETSITYIWIIIAIIASFFGTLGDLVESKFKRMANVKDSGKIMPGHGGVLDRLDSIIFVAPFVYLFYQILYYVS